MNIDRPQSRHGEQSGRQDLPVSGHHAQVGGESGERFDRFRSIGFFWLKDRHAPLERQLFERIDMAVVASPRAIRLREQPDHSVFVLEQRPKGRQRKAAGCHHHEAKSHGLLRDRFPESDGCDIDLASPLHSAQTARLNSRHTIRLEAAQCAFEHVVGRNGAGRLLTAELSLEVRNPRIEFASCHFGHPVDEQNPVDMIVLVLNDPRFQVFEVHLEFLSFEIERIDDDLLRPPDLPIEAREAQAPLLGFRASPCAARSPD